MVALGVDRDYIEYIMGHTISRYHDIQMKGIEFLRGIYIARSLIAFLVHRYASVKRGLTATSYKFATPVFMMRPKDMEIGGVGP